MWPAKILCRAWNLVPADGFRLHFGETECASRLKSWPIPLLARTATLCMFHPTVE
jgi:hypothetical protein